jgi:hypothetical protein
MGITTTLLEYAVLVYVMAIVIAICLYILEHYEIRYVEEENILRKTSNNNNDDPFLVVTHTTSLL